MTKNGGFLKLHLKLCEKALALIYKFHIIRGWKTSVRINVSKLMKDSENTVKEAISKNRAARTFCSHLSSFEQQDIVGNSSV